MFDKMFFNPSLHTDMVGDIPVEVWNKLVVSPKCFQCLKMPFLLGMESDILPFCPSFRIVLRHSCLG